MCNAPIVGTSRRRFPRLCACASTIVVKIFIFNHCRPVEPDRLPREPESFVTEISPAGPFRQVAKFGKRKGARGGKPRIIPRHWFAKNERRQKVNADCSGKAAAQIPKNAFSILLSHTPEVYRQAASEHFDVMLTDFRLPGEDGMKLIARAKSLSKPPVCILMTAYGSEEVAVDAMKRGADDYIAKGRLQIDELEMRIARALRQRNLEVENVALHQQLDSRFRLEKVVGDSPQMRRRRWR